MLVKNTFWYAFGTAVAKIARAVVIIYVAKILGAGQYGIFTYAMSLVGIFMIFADLGITSILTRELSKEGEEKYTYLSTAFLVKIGFLLFAIATSAVFGPMISKFPEAKPLIILIAVFVATESLRGFLYAITRAQNKMQIEAGLNIVSEIISVLVVVVLFLKHSSAQELAYAFIIGNLIGLFITLFFLRKNFVGLFKKFEPKLVKTIINSSWPFAVMGVFGVFMTNIDSVMIGFWNSPVVLGLYAAAQKPISLLYVLPAFLSVSLFPLISKLVSNGESRTKKVVEKSCRTSLSLALPIIFGGILLAGPILNVTFGQEYIGAGLTFQILLLTLLPAFPGAVFSDVIMAENGQKLFIKSTAAGAITNVLLNFILIPKYGIVGSAFATLAAQIVMNGILYMKIKKTYGISLRNSLNKILPASIGMSVIAYLLKTLSTPLIIIVPLCVIIYVGLLYVMREEVVLDIKQSFNA